MPRHRIEDPTTPGLYTQVSWRKHDEIPESNAPGHVQVATINERADSLLRDLLDTAATLLLDPQAATTDEWWTEASEWVERMRAHCPELTGWYASHTTETLTELTKTLHKAKRQAFGEQHAVLNLPDGPIRVIGDEQIRAAERGAWVPTGPDGEGYVV